MVVAGHFGRRICRRTRAVIYHQFCDAIEPAAHQCCAASPRAAAARAAAIFSLARCRHFFSPLAVRVRPPASATSHLRYLTGDKLQERTLKLARTERRSGVFRGDIGARRLRNPREDGRRSEARGRGEMSCHGIFMKFELKQIQQWVRTSHLDGALYNGRARIDRAASNPFPKCSKFHAIGDVLTSDAVQCCHSSVRLINLLFGM